MPSTHMQKQNRRNASAKRETLLRTIAQELRGPKFYTVRVQTDTEIQDPCFRFVFFGLIAETEARA